MLCKTRTGTKTFPTRRAAFLRRTAFAFFVVCVRRFGGLVAFRLTLRLRWEESPIITILHLEILSKNSNVEIISRLNYQNKI